MALLTIDEFDRADLADWRMLCGKLHARFATGDFATGVALTEKIGRVADEANHHPTLDVTYPRLLVTLWSHDAGGVTERDLALAREISALAAESEISADPQRLSLVEMALDVADIDVVRPFWAAVLSSPDPGEGDEIADPDGLTPTLWFQQSEPVASVPPQRFHYDIWVSAEQVQPRIDAALAAGGTMVTDQYAPAFIVLADPEGNKACLCTRYGRDDS